MNDFISEDIPMQELLNPCAKNKFRASKSSKSLLMAKRQRTVSFNSPSPPICITKVEDDDKVSIMRFKKKTQYLMDDDPENLGSSDSAIVSGGSSLHKTQGKSQFSKNKSSYLR